MRKLLLLASVLALALFAAVPALAQGQDGGPSDDGEIAVFKTLCDDIGQQDTCMGRDTSLDGFEIDFLVFEGEDNTGPLVQTITVTLGENENGGGNLGNGSMGRAVGEPLPAGDTFTVCEVEEARNPETGEVVLLDAEPRPEAGNGGSTGGQQTQFGENCITVELTDGTAELKFLDEVAEVVDDDATDDQYGDDDVVDDDVAADDVADDVAADDGKQPVGVLPETGGASLLTFLLPGALLLTGVGIMVRRLRS